MHARTIRNLFWAVEAAVVDGAEIMGTLSPMVVSKYNFSWVSWTKLRKTYHFEDFYGLDMANTGLW